MAGSDAARGSEPNLDVTLNTTLQSDILAAGRLDATVEARDALELKLRGRSRIVGEERSVKVAKSRTIELDAGQKASLKLPLTPSGRERLGRCEEQQLLVKIRASLAPDPLGGDDDTRGLIAQQLVIDDPACAPQQG
jgi:hypothetical protein